jgi:hypothetical protein
MERARRRRLVWLSLLGALALGCGGSSTRHSQDNPSASSAGTGASGNGSVGDAGPINGGGTASSSGTAGSGVVDEPQPNDAPSPAQPICEQLGRARCSRLEDCSPAELVRQYGTKQSCEATEAAQCLLWVDASDNVEAAAVSATIRSEMIALGTCAAQASLVGYASTPGSRAVGASCERFEQCASRYCEPAPGGLCGTCRPAPVLAEHVGEPCEITETSVGCATPGLVCDLTRKTCIEPPGLGQACVQSGPNPSPRDWCAPSLLCAAGKCVTPLFYGDSCTTSDDHCSSLEGLVCSANGTCTVATPLHVEGACGGDPSAGDCGLADRCEKPSADKLDDRPGKCVPNVTGYGDPCSGKLDCPSALSCILVSGAGGAGSGVCGLQPLTDGHCD